MSVAADLCAACGLCCTGWIDHHVRLNANDIQRLPATVRVVQKPHGPVIPQPCQCYTGGSCGIYAQRPVACSEFECLSFTALRRAEITFDEARTRVASAVEATRSLDDALRAAGWTEPGEAGPDSWWRFMAAMRAAGDDIAFRRRYAGVLLAIAAYQQLAEHVLVHELVVE